MLRERALNLKYKSYLIVTLELGTNVTIVLRLNCCREMDANNR